MLKPNGIIIDNLSALLPQLLWLSAGLSVVFPAACEVLLYHPVSVSGPYKKSTLHSDGSEVKAHVFDL